MVAMAGDPRLRSASPGVLFLTLLAVLFLGACASSGESESTTGAKPAPDFTVDTFDGGTFSLAEERGTPVVLNFWESW